LQKKKKQSLFKKQPSVVSNKTKKLNLKIIF